MMAKVVFFKRYQISCRQAPSASPVQSQNRESLSFLGKVGDDSPLGKSHAFLKEVHRNLWNLASILFGFWPFFECSQFNYTNVWWFLKCVCKIHNCIGLFFHVWIFARKIQEFWPNAEGQPSKLRNLSFQFGNRRVIVLPMKNAAVLWL